MNGLWLEPALGRHYAHITLAGSPEIAYPQGAADLCVAHRLASAVYHLGDTTVAAAIAACARDALGSQAMTLYWTLCARHRLSRKHRLQLYDVNCCSVDGWAVEKLKDHNPLAGTICSSSALMNARDCNAWLVGSLIF